MNETAVGIETVTRNEYSDSNSGAVSCWWFQLMPRAQQVIKAWHNNPSFMTKQLHCQRERVQKIYHNFHQIQWSQPFLMHSSLCSFWNFSFLTYYTNSEGSLKGIKQFFLKENVRYLVWLCRHPISLILGTRIWSPKQLLKTLDKTPYLRRLRSHL